MSPEESSSRGPIEVLPLDQMYCIQVDENNIWHRPEYPRYSQELAPAKPFLVPSFDSEVVEVLPSEKQDRKIRFEETVDVMEIENRWQMMEAEEIDDDESYEIEIVENANSDDDADFYLEMIDGEIFYVFETEDDISVDDEDEYESGSDASSSDSSDSETQSGQVAPLQLNFADMMAPNLCGEVDVADIMTPPAVVALANTIEIEDNTEVSSKTDSVTKLNDEVSIDEQQQQESETNLTSSPPPSAAPASPVSPAKQSVAAKFDTPPVSPQRSAEKLSVCGSPGTPTTPRSILKASIASPIKSPSKKKREKKPKKKDNKEKTFTKTFVRAADFDGEHRVYSWEKPVWTNKQLKSTGQGENIRSGGNLAQPITDAAKLIEKGTVKWEKPEWALPDPDQDICAKEELIKQIQEGGMQLPGRQHNKGRLKLSINGSILADGGDIVKPITKATIIKKPSNVNYVANPKILRATPVGQKLWKGENLAGPVTSATTEKKYEWEKPSWVKPKLHETESGQLLKAGTDVAPPITQKKGEWEKPDWTNKRRIGRTKSEIPVEATKKEYSWEKPSWVKARLRPTEEGALKETEKGQLARNGENLARPITDLPHMRHSHSFDKEETKEMGRQLRRTTSFD